jgi:hypothetical protein
MECAMIPPVPVLLFLVSFDGGRAISVYLKLRWATYVLASITNQYPIIHDSDSSGILGAPAKILYPYSSTPIVAKVSEVDVATGGTATLTWSDALNGTARAVGSSITIPSGDAPTSACSCLIYVELSYSFKPMFGYFPGGTIVG